MSSPVALVLICALAAVCLAIWYVPAYRRAREWRLVTCPEVKERAVVRPDAFRYAATSLGKRPLLRLKDCTRWPERAGCGQECVARLEKSRKLTGEPRPGR